MDRDPEGKLRAALTTISSRNHPQAVLRLYDTRDMQACPSMFTGRTTHTSGLNNPSTPNQRGRDPINPQETRESI
jgi:hypothetical protein